MCAVNNHEYATAIAEMSADADKRIHCISNTQLKIH